MKERYPVSFEDIVRGAGRGGWEWFDRLPEDVRNAVEIKQAETDAEARTIAAAWASFAATPGGRQALELLFDTTLRRTVYFVQLGLPPGQVAAFGAFREGQMALAQEIARQISIGRGDDDQPKPRDI